MEHVTMYPVVVKDAFQHGVQRFTRLEVHTDNMPLGRFVLKRNHYVLHVETGITRESLGNYQQGFRKSLNSHLRAAFDRALELLEVLRAGDLEGASSWDNKVIFDGVLDGAEPIADG